MSNEGHKYRLKFSGPAFNDGSIEVTDLIPALVGLNDLVKESNRLIHGESARLTTRVQATREGSFELDLQTIQTFWESTTNWLHSKDYDAVTKIAELVGIIAGGGVGLFALISWIGKKKVARKDETNEESVKITLQDGASIIVDKQVVILLDSPEIKKHMKEFTRPLDNEGVESIGFYEEGGNEISSFTKSDRQNFLESLNPVIDPTESVRETHLFIDTLSFRPDGKWRFSETHGAYFFAVISDESFLSGIRDNTTQFSKNDILKVLLKQVQIQTPEGVLKTTFEVLKVIEHKKNPQQIEMFREDSEPDG